MRGQLRLYMKRLKQASQKDQDQAPWSSNPRFTTEHDIKRSGRARPPQDHEIIDSQIMVIDNGPPEGPFSTSFVLSRLSSDESLRMIQPYIPPNPPDGSSFAKLAICKIVNKRYEYESKRRLKEQRKGSSTMKQKTKELDITWSIDSNDLDTKMRQMSGFLGKGMRVELLLSRKKGGKQVSPEEAAELVKRVRDEMKVQGAREARPASGHIGKTLTLFIERIEAQ